jgi:hypothetical protein
MARSAQPIAGRRPDGPFDDGANGGSNMIRRGDNPCIERMEMLDYTIIHGDYKIGLERRN